MSVIRARLGGGRGCLLLGLSAWLLAAAPPSAVSRAGTPSKPGGTSGPSDSYQGRTSQGRDISFRVNGPHLSGLQFTIDVVCPSRRIWRVTATVSAPIQIVASRFHQRFSSHRPGAAGTATIKGQLKRGRVTGTVAMRRYIAPEHRFCSGTATFNVRPPRRDFDPR